MARDGRLYPLDDLNRGILCSPDYLQYTIEKASDGFVYSAEETIRQGFIPLRGGHRLGVCGHAVLNGPFVSTIKDFSSICIRIARDLANISSEGTQAVYANGKLRNTLIISPPLAGKTTYLRDLIRQLWASGQGFAMSGVRSLRLYTASRSFPWDGLSMSLTAAQKRKLP